MSCRNENSNPNSGPGANTPPNTPVQPCVACTVTLTPGNVVICGAGSTAVVTAAGNPAGGSYTFSSSDSSRAGVSGTGDRGTITAAAQGTAVVTVTYNVSGCTPCTATANVKVCTCTQGRKYAFVRLLRANLVGARCRIKTRYGKLCCEIEGCSTVSAFHAVYANISNHESGMKWAQVGFSRRRNAGSTAIIQYRKAEIQGDNYFIDMDTANAPAEGSTHEWQCQLNKSTGQWSYSDNGTVWRTYTDTFWQSHLGGDLNYTGEILNAEDDMPGTSGDKCQFTDCQYKLDGAGYVDAGIRASDLNNTDTAGLGIERVSGTAFNIWDKQPNT
jgi:hypothetical protein